VIGIIYFCTALTLLTLVSAGDWYMRCRTSDKDTQDCAESLVKGGGGSTNCFTSHYNPTYWCYANEVKKMAKCCSGNGGCAEKAYKSDSGVFQNYQNVCYTAEVERVGVNTTTIRPPESKKEQDVAEDGNHRLSNKKRKTKGKQKG
jgi:hypothetical protein